jgi:transposase
LKLSRLWCHFRPTYHLLWLYRILLIPHDMIFKYSWLRLMHHQFLWTCVKSRSILIESLTHCMRYQGRRGTSSASTWPLVHHLLERFNSFRLISIRSIIDSAFRTDKTSSWAGILTSLRLKHLDCRGTWIL